MNGSASHGYDDEKFREYMEKNAPTETGIKKYAS